MYINVQTSEETVEETVLHRSSEDRFLAAVDKSLVQKRLTCSLESMHAESTISIRLTSF